VTEAIADPKVKGVTCHITYFSRGMIDRLRQGNWFGNPSNSSIACRQTGAMVIDTIETDEGGEEIFSQHQSLIFKVLAVRRVSDTLIYGCPTGRAAFAQACAGQSLLAIPGCSRRGQSRARRHDHGSRWTALLPSAPAAEPHPQSST
jgi:catabolite regulation protein CreA